MKIKIIKIIYIIYYTDRICMIYVLLLINMM